MEKKTSSVSELVKVLDDVEKANKDNKDFNNLKQANDFYNKMLSEGIIKKRGNTLRGIEQAHLLYSTIGR
ncbi:MAG: hypothetical protein J7497_08080 [Chitinophagaceae bacterium]|nr:hypothetical protein [Chitinophagaceae bacterium]